MVISKNWSFASRLNRKQAEQIKKAIQFRNAEVRRRK